MLDYRQGQIVYAKGSQVRCARVATRRTRLAAEIPVEAVGSPLFSTDALGLGVGNGHGGQLARRAACLSRPTDGATATSHTVARRDASQ